MNVFIIISYLYAQMLVYMEKNEQKVYERPLIKTAVLEDALLICLSPNGSNEDYINDDYDW